MALNFCLALRPPLLKVTPELLMILQEALGIAEADEQVRSQNLLRETSGPMVTVSYSEKEGKKKQRRMG
jgi:hypothetical protein